MKKTILILSLTFGLSIAIAQTSQWGVPTGNPQFPKDTYIELPDPSVKDLQKWSAVNGTQISWVTTDIRYNKGEVPSLKKNLTTETIKGWRGERVSAQALVYSSVDLNDLTFEMSPLTGKGGQIDAQVAFVRYVMQDNFLTCGFRSASKDYDSTLVADPIDHLARSLKVEAQTTRPIWVSVWIPQDVAAGLYAGKLTIKNGESTIGTLNLSVEVINRVLPKPTEWVFHLDFWQNPFAEARYAGIDVFTPEFFAYVRPQYERLRDAGQKIITTSIMHKPWGGQTEDYFETMISWIKRTDGTWAFDYTTFDLWVEFMMDLGIDQQIACYSMIPWNMSFKYYDQASNSMKEIKTTTYTKEYADMWTAVLKSLSAHLREKGWFDRTVIAMDERPTEDMLNAFKIINTADKDFKVSLAGGNHPEIEEQLYDYSMASDDLFKPEVIAKRRSKGQKTTFYTCCAQAYPNVFTYSEPAEGEWIGWFAAAKDYDGYLRWAYDSYTKEPLLDARFRAFQSGDSYTVYPQARTSIRMEKFVDGVEAYEKIRILKDEFTAKNDTKSLKKIDAVLADFNIVNFKNGVKPDQTLTKARAVLNTL